MKIRIHKYTIESVLVLLPCLNIVVLNSAIPGLSTIFYYFRLLMILYILANTYVSRARFASSMKMILLFVLWIIGVSILRGGAVSSSIRAFSTPLLLCLYVDQKRNRPYLVECIGVWVGILLTLVIIDFITQILFPSGMYRDSMYTLNWFLGYKTARLVYELPLCVFEAIHSMWKNNKLGKRFYLCSILSVYTLYHGQATSAMVTLALICVFIILICNTEKKVENIDRFWECMVNMKIVVPVYTVATLLTVYIQNSPLIQFVVVNILKKDPTLSTRTSIWNNCIEVLRTHPITGVGYLSIEKYQEISNNIYATSAHNMSLTILVSGGFLAIALYIGIMITASRNLKKNHSIYNKIASIGVIAVLIVGITSSSIVFSMCGFIFYLLMEINISISSCNRKGIE